MRKEADPLNARFADARRRRVDIEDDKWSNFYVGIQAL